MFPPSLFFHIFSFALTENSEDSPHAADHAVTNGVLSGPGADGPDIPNAAQIPAVQTFSPLTSPLLAEAGYVRNEDEEEARRKV